MKQLFPLAWKSFRNRWATVSLTVFAIACSVTLLLGVEKIRTGAKQSFTDTISGTDLIVGARSGSIQLLLYSIFHVGNATTNVSWDTYQKFAAMEPVAWTVPLSLGDSYAGFRVLGTNQDYFKHYKYGNKRQLEFSDGRGFGDHFDTVLGADVARELGHNVGDKIVIVHGLREIGHAAHEDEPFTVAGILAKTGTPIDRTVHISLAGLEKIHEDFQQTGGHPDDIFGLQDEHDEDPVPESITAFLVGLKSRPAAIGMLRAVNTYRQEPLLAIMPGVTLQELWDTMGTVETALLAISLLVVATGLLGMITVILAGLNERRREIAILRSVGARPIHIFSLLVTEASFVAALGAGCGVGFLYIALFIAQPIIEARFGFYIPIELPMIRDFVILFLVIGAGFLSGFIPGYRAYRFSVADGMIVRT